MQSIWLFCFVNYLKINIITLIDKILILSFFISSKTINIWLKMAAIKTELEEKFAINDQQNQDSEADQAG